MKSDANHSRSFNINSHPACVPVQVIGGAYRFVKAADMPTLPDGTGVKENWTSPIDSGSFNIGHRLVTKKAMV
jgi:hypothetical protein